MADKRPFAKIDVSYPSNPKWFTIHRALQGAMQDADQNALQNAKRASMQAHFASILYCKRNLTDGIFPVAAIKAELDLFGDAEEAAITALFESGMWINHPGGMAEVRDYLEHQTESAKVKDISEKRRDAALSRWEKERTSDANSTANSTANSNTTSNAEKRREEESIKSAFEEWYGHYPKKVGRGDALKAFKTATKKIDLETLIEATKRYAASVQGQDRKFIKNNCGGR